MFGKVVAYYPDKGYGFIQGDDGKKYFAPCSEVKTASGVLEKGYTAEFTLPTSGNRAYNVRYL